MRLLYLHDFTGFCDAKSSKAKSLQILGEVVVPDIEYLEGFNTAFKNASTAATFCDLVVGTGMGGYMASHVGAALGIPFVALNPVIAPQESLLKYAGSLTDYSVNEKYFDQATIEDYPCFQTVDGCGLILLESDDDVISPQRTLEALDGIYQTKMIAGGSHRFSNLADQIGEIALFLKNAELVYGLASD